MKDEHAPPPPPAPAGPPPSGRPGGSADLATETVRSLLASIHLMLADRERALSLFNLSEQGFWRSFMAIAVALPLYLLAVRLGIPAVAETPAQKAVVGAVLFKASLLLLLEWLLWLVAAALLVRPLGLAAHYGRYVIIYNWSSPLILALQIIPALLYFTGLIGRDAAAFMFLFLLGVALYVRWQNARTGLKAPGLVAIGLVLADVLLSMVLHRLLA
jgi:hypothetical protein